MNRVIVELNELEPDVVICSGDLTNEGYRQEYKNWAAYAERIRAPMYTVPGNHDARNVGYLHFEELVGPAPLERRRRRASGSSAWTPASPTSTRARSGASATRGSTSSSRSRPTSRSSSCTTTCCPIPGTGRERSTVMDAGDLLEVLIQSGVNIVLSGHKHVPYVWRLEDLYVANAGTVASLRLRGYTKPCYNVLEFEGDEVKITRKYPFGGGSVIAHFRLSTRGAVPSRARAAGAAAPPPRGSPGGVLAPNRTISKEAHRMKVVVLVDGEHYPPVTRWAIDELRERGLRADRRAVRRRRREARPVRGARPRDPPARFGAGAFGGVGARRRDRRARPRRDLRPVGRARPRLPRADGGRGRGAGQRHRLPRSRLPARPAGRPGPARPSRRSRCWASASGPARPPSRARPRGWPRRTASIRSSSRWAAGVRPNPRSPRPGR